MATLLLSRLTVVWLVLMAATGLSMGVGREFASSDTRAGVVIIIVIAFSKVRLVIQEFMEIRTAPKIMRLAGDTWVLAICTTLIVLSLRAAA